MAWRKRRELINEDRQCREQISRRFGLRDATVIVWMIGTVGAASDSYELQPRKPLYPTRGHDEKGDHHVVLEASMVLNPSEEQK